MATSDTGSRTARTAPWALLTLFVLSWLGAAAHDVLEPHELCRDHLVTCHAERASDGPASDPHACTTRGCTASHGARDHHAHEPADPITTRFAPAESQGPRVDDHCALHHWRDDSSPPGDAVTSSVLASAREPRRGDPGSRRVGVALLRFAPKTSPPVDGT